jgi:hypothetical protein
VGSEGSGRVVYWFERVSEIIAIALCATLVVSLVAKDEQRFALRQPFATIEEQYAMSWSIDQSLADALPQRMSAVLPAHRP